VENQAPTLPVTGTSEVVLVAVASALIIGGAALLALLRSRRKEATGR
jgi:LPXTG-motif cell wall-anchored protein